MQILFVLLSVVVSQQFCYGALTKRSPGPLHLRLRRSYDFKNLPVIDDLAPDEKRAMYNYEQTIVVRDADPNNKVRRCAVVEVNNDREATEGLRYLKAVLNMESQKIDMERMMSLISDCDSVDDLGILPGETEDSVDNLPLASTFYLFNEIVLPGTKWCGPGDNAKSYHDLGILHNVDRCCRSHDLCPIKVLGEDKHYNLTNTGSFTKSHCLCDNAFHDCLKKDNGWTAVGIGNVYFIVSRYCIKGLPEHPEEKMEFVRGRKWFDSNNTINANL